MANFKQLHDLYRFPGFVPSHRIKGRFGDPMAVVLSLQRNRKKRSVECVAKLASATTTSGDVGFVISPAVTSASISRSCCEECRALGVTA